MNEMERIAEMFQQHPRYPRTEHNTIALYCVDWTTKSGKRTGNQWTSLVQAMKVYMEKAQQGRNPKGSIRYVAGFAPL